VTQALASAGRGTPEELAQNGVRREIVPEVLGGAFRTLCATATDCRRSVTLSPAFSSAYGVGAADIDWSPACYRTGVITSQCVDSRSRVPASESVLVYADEAVFRARFQCAFESDPEFGLVGVCQNPADLISQAEEHQPQLIIFAWTGGSDLPVVEELRRVTPNSAIVLSAHDLGPDLSSLAAELGVRAFLSTGAGPEILKQCLRVSIGKEAWSCRPRSLRTSLRTSVRTVQRRTR
jgi:AmiR/NasT family two-component response regulator